MPLAFGPTYASSEGILNLWSLVTSYPVIQSLFFTDPYKASSMNLVRNPSFDFRLCHPKAWRISSQQISLLIWGRQIVMKLGQEQGEGHFPAAWGGGHSTRLQWELKAWWGQAEGACVVPLHHPSVCMNPISSDSAVAKVEPTFWLGSLLAVALQTWPTASWLHQGLAE